jgi:hypothetical protein
MASGDMICPKCKGNLERGYIPDFDFNLVVLSSWQQGEPKKSRLTLTKKPTAKGIPIASFRCSQCGFIEFYADTRFAAK